MLWKELQMLFLSSLCLLAMNDCLLFEHKLHISQNTHMYNVLVPLLF